MPSELELLPLSGLQHLVFCERQCALIHVERVWRENALTAAGRVLHERVDANVSEGRGDLRILRGVPLRSRRLGVFGRSDVVELHRAVSKGTGCRVPGLDGWWRPFPVEYKRGQPKWIDCDRVQLCAQGMCLEEMCGVSISAGALFYGKIRRREDVEFDAALRAATESAARRFHEMSESGVTPVARRAPKCRTCSLVDICLPPSNRAPRPVADYMSSALAGGEE